jgi:hypothetical protein
MLCVWRYADVQWAVVQATSLAFPTSVSDMFDLRSTVVLLSVCGMVLACLEPSPSFLDASVHPSSGECLHRPAVRIPSNKGEG